MSGGSVVLLGGAKAQGDFRPLVPDHQIFRQDGKPFRYKGVTCFPLGAMWRDGHVDDIDRLMRAFEGFNIFRTFEYVDWPGTGWASTPVDKWLELLEHLRIHGWGLELCLLTSDEAFRIPYAQQLATELGRSGVTNCLLEGGNEAKVHKNIDTAALKVTLEQSGLPYCSGDSGESPDFYGSYLNAHTGRDQDWPRRCHDLLEYYQGGGPSSPIDPPHHMPCLADEPIRPDEAGYVTTDFTAYFGGCALLGGGATFHYENGKYGKLPTTDEARCAAAALLGLNAFPADTPLGPYRRIDEHGNTSRTYVVGDCAVRIRPTTPDFPESGWTSLDPDHILWRRS